MRNNLEPFKYAGRVNDSTTPKNILLPFNKSREGTQETKQTGKSPKRTTYLERANSDLFEQFPDTHLTENRSNQEIEESILMTRKLFEERTNSNERFLKIENHQENSSHYPYIESSLDTGLDGLNTYQKVDVLQRDIDHLKQKIVSQKADKLKREIKALKQQLNTGYSSTGTGPVNIRIKDNR